MRALIAASSVTSAVPPRLRLATAGVPATWSAITQLMPLTVVDVKPEPAQSSTFTGTMVTPFATPYVVPPRVPATWVPWPLQSLGDEGSYE